MDICCSASSITQYSSTPPELDNSAGSMLKLEISVTAVWAYELMRTATPLHASQLCIPLLKEKEKKQERIIFFLGKLTIRRVGLNRISFESLPPHDQIVLFDQLLDENRALALTPAELTYHNGFC